MKLGDNLLSVCLYWKFGAERTEEEKEPSGFPSASLLELTCSSSAGKRQVQPTAVSTLHDQALFHLL